VLSTGTLVGNAFLPSSLTRHTASMTTAGQLRVTGHIHESINSVLSELAAEWRRLARKCGFVVLPGSFRPGQVGSDIHYAGTLPMRPNPKPGEVSPRGALYGLPDVYVVDASILPDLPAKPHTLTAMPMADHIARQIVRPDD
jgi:choline dehydrogenase-like flavoprotein